LSNLIFTAVLFGGFEMATSKWFNTQTI